MIRFCDKQINYILGDRKGEQVSDYSADKYLMMNHQIWEDGRKYLRECFQTGKQVVVMPVFNHESRLICFAWQDKDANRQLRMLEELQSCEDTLNFRDIYPEIETVTIHGCNELAYYLLMYLEKIGVPVIVTGGLWRELGIYRDEKSEKSKNWTIYAEGVGNQEDDEGWYRSVSAEFEIIDHIYEENILHGKIRDASGRFEDFIEKVKGREIGILGVGTESLDAYDLLLKNGLDISFFVSDGKEKQEKIIYGKKVMGFWEAQREFKETIIIDAHMKHSAWGGGETDFYDYLGYKRNQAFYLIRDYVEIPRNGLRNVLCNIISKSGGRLILTGDIWLCGRLRQILDMIDCERVVYLDVLNLFEQEKTDIKEITESEVCERDMCLLVLSEYYGNNDDSQKNKLVMDIKRNYISAINRLSVINIGNYDFDNAFIKKCEKEKSDVLSVKFKIKAILIGASDGFSGNKFFRDLLDNHPNILMLDWSSLNNNLFTLCVRLAMMKATRILAAFWNFCEEQKDFPDEKFDEDFPHKEIFNQSMQKMLEIKESFTSQELFVMIHIAYAKMWGRKVENISNMLIYWEPHHVPRDKCEDYAIWLHTVADSRYIVNIVRNAYVSAGSYLKLLNRLNISFYGVGVFSQIFKYLNKEKKDYDGWNRITLRFEDIKCKPVEELSLLCNKLNIIWSDTLMETTIHGKTSSLWGITGFDLKPVYYTYEEYFSSFDRFRITLITAPWQKQYGYPYVDNLDFNRRQLQEMFSKEFRFEKESYRSYDEKKRIRIEVQKLISACLQINRRKEIMEGRNHLNESMRNSKDIVV